MPISMKCVNNRRSDETNGSPSKATFSNGTPDRPSRLEFTIPSFTSKTHNRFANTLKRARRARRTSLAPFLQCGVDGKDCGLIDLIRSDRVGVGESGDMRFSWEDDQVAVYSDKVQLASYYLPDPAVLEEDEEIEESITIEGGQKISFIVSLSNDGDGDVSGVIRVRYEENNPLRIAARQVQRLINRANEIILPTFKPKWIEPCPPTLDQEIYGAGGVIVENRFAQAILVLSSILIMTFVLMCRQKATEVSIYPARSQTERVPAPVVPSLLPGPLLPARPSPNTNPKSNPRKAIDSNHHAVVSGQIKVVPPDNQIVSKATKDRVIPSDNQIVGKAIKDRVIPPDNQTMSKTTDKVPKIRAIEPDPSSQPTNNPPTSKQLRIA